MRQVSSAKLPQRREAGAKKRIGLPIVLADADTIEKKENDMETDISCGAPQREIPLHDVFLAFQQQGDRPVIDQFDIHHGAKYSGAHMLPGQTFIQVINEQVVQRFGMLRRSGIRIAGPVSMTRIAIERELRNHHDIATDVFDGIIHLPRFIVKNPQLRTTACKVFAIGLRVAVFHAEEDQDALSDRTLECSFDRNRTSFYPLD